MSILNEFVCPNVRFKFWNGNKGYTVEYSPGINMWFVFDGEMETDCLAKYEPDNKKEVCSIETAASYLDKYFQSVNSENFATY